ncbi:MAG: RNA polymerase factor sigma-54 [Methyloligellaceae bacterium]
MALTSRLELKQNQGLVMTPQLQQAIKLLQLSNIELTAYVEAELQNNPLLERAEGEEEAAAPQTEEAPEEGETGAEDWLDLNGGSDGADAAGVFDTEEENVFPESADPAPAPAPGPEDSWAAIPGSGGQAVGGEANLEAYVAEEISLRDHLTEQMNLAIGDPVIKLIAGHLIDMVDDDGYMRGSLESVAERLGAPLELVEQTLTALQGLEPVGVFARDLAECLTIQLKERNRYDPAIAALVANLDLIAAHDIPALKRACGVDDEDLADMIAEIKSLNPKPGLSFGGAPVQAIVPDVFVRQRPDGSWLVELNSDTLPKVLVNQSYYATVSKTARSPKDKAYLSDCLQTANWLVKSLDQRARTILKVAREIVRQQDAFLTKGVQFLRPLNLKTVAEAINMHESTVSRVTSNKYMATSRGTFELKYFFTSAIPAAGAGEAHSSEAVRHRIKQLIDNEAPDRILSDDKIVELLNMEGIEIARRTVAKYRESLRIPSSVQRRRQKKLSPSL